MEKIKGENPEAYKDAQKTGVMASPGILKRYLLTGQMPKIGVRWITREEFIESYEEK